MVLDGCDGNNPANPMNWKGGGFVQVGKVRYRIDPKALRQPPPRTPGGGCSFTGNALADHVWIWGNGWENSDFGEGLKRNLRACGLSTFKFSYGLGKDGREWTAEADTGVFQNGCYEIAAKGAGAQSEFGCASI
jgi:hypothetical protein